MSSDIWEMFRDLERDTRDFQHRAFEEDRDLRQRLYGLLIRAREAGMKNSEIAQALNSGNVSEWSLPRWSTQKVTAAARDAEALLRGFAGQLENSVEIGRDEDEDDDA